MELGFEILWGFIKGIIISLMNPYTLVLIILCILLTILYPKLRGYMGEFWVKLELLKLNKKNYIILNNIMIESNQGTHQIDHIVISKFGIFVIEMKNYYGLIKGDDLKDKWTQYLGKNKYFFKNPIHQNYGHVKALSSMLNIPDNCFIPIVCFSNSANIDVTSKNIVVQIDGLTKLIKKFYKPLIENNLDDIKEIILKSNIVDKEKRRLHVKNIKNKIKLDNDKVKNMICPKCGNELVLRNGKNGTFIGCSSYPKCKYTKNN